jgi:6-phosphogluconolactonase
MTAIRVLPNPDALADAAARLVAEDAQAAINARGRFSIALSGGSTPRALHAKLSSAPLKDQIDWPNVHIFFGDERCVPPGHPDSNYRMALDTLLSKVPVPETNVHRIEGELPPPDAATRYDQALKAFLGADAPSLDLILLGMGDNGHTASLFPGLTAVHETDRWVVAEYVAEVGIWRITLTPAVLNAARACVFLVAGANKARMLKRVLEGPYNPSELPAQVVRPSMGDVLWLVDAAATADLTPPSG